MTNSEHAVQSLFEARAIKSESGTTRDASDGRIANRLRNRERVIDVFVDLINEGENGTLDQIVERSGVARRSVFRYFTDLTDLAMSGFQRVVADASTIAFYSNPGQGALVDRIDHVIEVRLKTHQITHPFGLMARRRLAHLEAVTQGLRVVVDITRAQLEEQFGPEVSGRSASEAAALLDNVTLVISFESYDLSKRQLGRTDDEIAASWRAALTALFAAR